ncbi:MAG: hypothetical protein PF904_14330 [Kiritimatiellae bacterium]|nr:hypothetical protein [Kiritimatiellia bacterium]
MKKIISLIFTLVFCAISFVAGRYYEAYRPAHAISVHEEVMQDFKSFKASMSKSFENDNQLSAAKMLAVLKKVEEDKSGKIKTECIKQLAKFYTDTPDLPDGFNKKRDQIKQHISDYAEKCPELKQQIAANKKSE